MLLDQAKQVLAAERVAGGTFSAGLYMGLTSAGPAESRTLIDTDITPYEVTWSGYGRASVGSWGSPSLSADGHGVETAADVVFANSSGAPVSADGWFYYSMGQGKIVLYKLFGVTITIPAGGSITLSPKWTTTGE